MRKGALALTLAAGVVTAAATVGMLATSARAQEVTCIPGFTLVTGGVPEADLNGDGLTCELNSVDVTSVVWTTIAHDNAVIDPLAVEIGCPDGFVGDKSLVCCKSVPPGAVIAHEICIPPMKKKAKKK